MSSAPQKLANAQVSVNRAVFLMNAQHNPGMSTSDTSDTSIAAHIKEAMDELLQAYNGYAAQKELF